MKLEYKVPKGWKWLKPGELLKSGDKAPFVESWLNVPPTSLGAKIACPKFFIRRIKTK